LILQAVKNRSLELSNVALFKPTSEKLRRKIVAPILFIKTLNFQAKWIKSSQKKMILFVYL